MAGPNYWWVNHKQTFRSETEGGYIWSPKTNSNGARNQTYDNLLKVQPGDVVVSYADAKIKVVGIATGSCREAPKPEEFGSAGASWSNVGWLVPIEWTSLSKPISPKEHIERIAPMLPPKNSPLQPNGNGNQGCYLASISPELGKLILSLASHEGLCLELELDGIADDIKSDLALQEVQDAVDISETEKEQLVRSRRGQGLFRQRVLAQEPRCRITGVEIPSLLLASHIKPWKDCNNAERLDGANGLMLAPHVDKLFDQGWISFRNDGGLLAAAEAIPVLYAWNIDPFMNVGPFSASQIAYLEYHRSFVLKALDGPIS